MLAIAFMSIASIFDMTGFLNKRKREVTSVSFLDIL